MLQAPENVRLYATSDGALVGFAAWQGAWAVLDFYVRPGPYRQAVETALFEWVPGRFRALDAERGRPLPYWTEAREDDSERLALIERHGYVLDDEYTYVMMSRPLDEPLPRSAPPGGVVIRSLAGARDVPAYVALHRRAFASTSMTTEWRTRTLSMPQYRPELDLVAVAPDEHLVGFCVGWGAPEGDAVQIEPLGVDPEFQGQGLGRALMLELFRRCQALGVGHVLVETESSRGPARRAYEAGGFRPIYQTLRKGQWFSGNRQ